MKPAAPARTLPARGRVWAHTAKTAPAYERSAQRVAAHDDALLVFEPREHERQGPQGLAVNCMQQLRLHGCELVLAEGLRCGLASFFEALEVVGDGGAGVV